MSRLGLGGAVVNPTVYLEGEINRPDLYEQRFAMESDITKGHHTTRVFRNILVIILSAFIFIAIVGWANVLKVGYDVLFVNDMIAPEFYATLYYALTVSAISLVMCCALYWFLVHEEIFALLGVAPCKRDDAGRAK